MKSAECSNCKSRRRRVWRRGFCSKCYYWDQKRRRWEDELAKATAKKPHARTGMIEYYVRVAKRVLEEYAWREEQLGKPDVHPFALEGLLYAVAAEARSEVGFAVHSLFADLNPQARRSFYAVLLAIVENIPARLPRLNTLTPPKRRARPMAWIDWMLDFHRI